MPILDGFGATRSIREIEKKGLIPGDTARPSSDLNNGIPIFAVSASLVESQREFMLKTGVDGWILKPIDFKRLRALMRGTTDPTRRMEDLYTPGYSWERGGWMRAAVQPAAPEKTNSMNTL
jgi:CheY-like chemotaxis protein